MLENIPAELRALPQWVVWRLETRDGKPTKVPYQGPNPKKGASVVSIADWTSFDVCASVVANGFADGVGFVFTDRDPYCGIDLDGVTLPVGDGPGEIHAPLRQIQNEVYQQIGVHGYCEWSPSGTGVHVIVKASNKGGHFAGVEVYSAERFFTMTGNVYSFGGVITEQNAIVQRLVQTMQDARSRAGSTGITGSRDGWAEAREDDRTILDAAYARTSGQQFLALWNLEPNLRGEAGEDYNDHSRGDMALMNYLQFHTSNREQLARLFFMSRRPTRPNWIDAKDRKRKIKYLIDQCLNRAVPEHNLAAMRLWMAADLKRQECERNVAMGREAEVVATAQAGIEAMASDLVAPVPPPDIANPYTLPPEGGLLADIARYIESSAQRPDPVIALTGALGLMAGICGSSFNVSRGGVNLYLMLTALSGSGKEAMTSGVGRITAALSARHIKAVSQFIGPSELASGPALFKTLKKTPCFVSFLDELGDKLPEMAEDSRNTAAKTLKSALLHLYTKSGASEQFDGSAYSDQQQSIKAIRRPSVSVVGYGTPGTVYKAIDERMMEQGVMARFLVVECLANRPDANPHASHAPSDDLLGNVGMLVTRCLGNMEREAVDNIELDEGAAALDRAWNATCDGAIRATTHEAERATWTRTRHMTLKVAALAAIGACLGSPVVVITARTYAWAQAIVHHSVRLLLAKMREGGLGVQATGSGEEANAQMVVVARALIHYATCRFEDVKGYDRVRPQMHTMKVAPHAYLLQRVQKSPAFMKSRGRPSDMLVKTLNDIKDRGAVDNMAVHTKDYIEAFGGNGTGKPSWMITDVEVLKEIVGDK